MAVIHEKRLEGVKATETLQRLLKKAVESSSHFDPDSNEFAQLKSFSLGKEQPEWIPIPIIQTMDVILKRSDATTTGDSACDELQTALRSTSLVFTAPPLSDDDNADASSLAKNKKGGSALEERKFRQRMQRLRFQHEETKYARLTNNLKMNAVADDVTTKSMTYAASIGLNMIVAPISFGVFMYFFAGSLLDYVWSSPSAAARGSAAHVPPDIKRIIVGVVSGVAMLFIEMLLFVIRTHEMDKAMRKKAKKKPSPFGHYSSESAKLYQNHDKAE
jgi:Endoplasmic reticulum-based factor for assembly of V-ATPase